MESREFQLLTREIRLSRAWRNFDRKKKDKKKPENPLRYLALVLLITIFILLFVSLFFISK
jgi:hypothetical protein